MTHEIKNSMEPCFSQVNKLFASPPFLVGVLFQDGGLSTCSLNKKWVIPTSNLKT
jgi:hypothetical protein